MTAEDKQTTYMTEEDILRVTGEIPLISKRDRPGSGSRSVTSAQGQRSRPSSGVRPKSSTLKKDPSKVLSYMKKNLYDDTGNFLNTYFMQCFPIL